MSGGGNSSLPIVEKTGTMTTSTSNNNNCNGAVAASWWWWIGVGLLGLFLLILLVWFIIYMNKPSVPANQVVYVDECGNRVCPPKPMCPPAQQIIQQPVQAMAAPQQVQRQLVPVPGSCPQQYVIV